MAVRYVRLQDITALEERQQLAWAQLLVLFLQSPLLLSWDVLQPYKLTYRTSSQTRTYALHNYWQEYIVLHFV